MSAYSDSTPFDTGSATPEGKNSDVQTTTGTAAGAGAEPPNKAHGFLASRGPSAEPQTSHPTAHVPPQSATSFNVPLHPNTTMDLQGRTESYAPTKHVRSVFNIQGANIKNAAIGNSGPVRFNTKSEVFHDGAKKQDFAISGGSFVQSNIGGSSKHKNVNSNLHAGGGAPTTDKSGAPKPIPSYPPYSPEQILIKILESGISTSKLHSLLEKEYSVTSLAFALPDNPRKRDAIVEALLNVPTVEEMDATDGRQA